MSLAQDIRNAYDWRDRDGLERLLAQVEDMERAARARRELAASQMAPWCADCGTRHLRGQENCSKPRGTRRVLTVQQPDKREITSGYCKNPDCTCTLPAPRCPHFKYG